MHRCPIKSHATGRWNILGEWYSFYHFKVTILVHGLVFKRVILLIFLGFPQVARHFLIPKCWVTFKQTEHLCGIQLDWVSKFLLNHTS